MIIPVMRLFRFASSSTGDFKTISSKLLAEFKSTAQVLASNENNFAILEAMKVKMNAAKSPVPLPKLCTINLLDAQNVELSALDQSFIKPIMSALQSTEKNFAVNQLTSSKLKVTLPKTTAEDRKELADQIRRKAEALKTELREVRRRDINAIKASTKDKDQIHRYEQEIQKEFDAACKSIDSLCAQLTLKTTGKQ